MTPRVACSMFCFFNDTATTEIYTLSLHDALPIFGDERDLQGGVPRAPARAARGRGAHGGTRGARRGAHLPGERDRKSTRLNSSHANISYAVFCLQKQTIVQPPR